MSSTAPQRGKAPQWATLPDGILEHISALLPRSSQLACRLVCLSWRAVFTHGLSPIAIDTRYFATSGCGDPAQIPPHQPSTCTQPLGAAWDSLTCAVGPSFPDVTVRISLHHESKARAAPCAPSCVACLNFLAAHPRYTQQRLALLLPLRFALPDTVLAALSGGLCRLRSLRLVRCSLTRQLAAVLGDMVHLRHLCIAHADLAALPQLLEAANHLEHLHVHGYHSLVIMEDNAHLYACWRAAQALLGRGAPQGDDNSDGNGGSSGGAGAGNREGGGGEGGQASSSSGGGGGGGGGGSGSGGGCRLRCLAVSAHHLYHDSVLDETELDFEAEALRWQIGYDGSYRGPGRDACEMVGPGAGRHAGALSGSRQASEANPGPNAACAGAGASTGASARVQLPAGVGDTGPAGCRAAATAWTDTAWPPGVAPGCWPHLQERCSRSGVPEHSGSSGAGGGGSRAAYMGGGSRGTALCAAALVGLRCGCVLDHGSTVPGVQTGPQGRVEGPESPAAVAVTATAAGTACAAAEVAAASGDAVAAQSQRARKAAAGLQLLKSGMRALCLQPEQELLAFVRQPHWQHLQYAQLQLTPGPLPHPPPPRQRPQHWQRLARATAVPSNERLGGGGGSGGTDAVLGSSETEADADYDTLWRLTLEPLSELPTLTGLWLDPDDWDGQDEAAVLQSPTVAPPTALDGVDVAAAAGALQPELGPGPGPAAAARWVRIGDVWTLLHKPPSPIAAHEYVQDAFPHARLLAGCARLRSLALGARRAAFLGVGDDTAAVLARLAGLTKLHLYGGYTLPLGEQPLPLSAAAAAAVSGVQADGSKQMLAAESVAAGPGLPALEGGSAGVEKKNACWQEATWRLPPRLAPLGSLRCLLRLALHFTNPLGRPAVVPHAALPPSLTSLSLHGVVLVPHGAATEPAEDHAASGPAATFPSSRLHASVKYAERRAMSADGGGTATAGGGGGDDGGGGSTESSSGAARRTAACRAPASLACLRELSLTSSYIERMDLLGCGPQLWMLSLRDSGVSVGCSGAGASSSPSDEGGPLREGRAADGGPSRDELLQGPMGGDGLRRYPGLRREGGAVQAGEGGAGALADLLHTCHGLETLRVLGSTATSREVQLPREGRAVDWYSMNSLHAIASCLPCLRMLHLSPPPAATSSPLLNAQPHGAATNHAPAAIATTATVDSLPTEPCPGAEKDSRLDLYGAGEDRHRALPRLLLPNWDLTRVAVPGAREHTDADGSGAGSRCRPDPQLPLLEAQPDDSVATAEACTANGTTAPGGPCPPNASPHRPAWDWLGNLLGLLCRYAPLLRSLHISCTAVDQRTAEHGAQVALAALPAGLPRLEHLTLVLDLPLSYILAQPQPESYARAWARWLQGAEQALQAQLRHTSVAVSPDPRTASEARKAAQAAALAAGR